MSLHCWVRYHFRLWWILPRRAGWFARTLCWLASDWNPVYVSDSHMIELLTFSPWGLRSFPPQRTANAKKIRLWSKAMPCTRLGHHFSWTAPFNSRVHHGLLFCYYLPHRVVSVHILENQVKLQLLWADATPPPRPLCIPRAFGTWTIRSLERSLSYRCPLRPPNVFGRCKCICYNTA